jgi:hypothetical protein
MSVTETLAFIYIGSQADTRTGIWSGCAKALAGELGISERTARDVLEKLQQRGYVRRFTSPGSHACYPILVNKFPITTGEHNGKQLNAMDSKSPTALAYFPRAHNGEQDGGHGAAQKRMENKEQRRRKKKSAETACAAQPVAFSSPLLVITHVHDARLADTYPWVDRPQEYRKMDLWLTANRPGRKVRNTLAFCQNWFNRIPCPSNRQGGIHGKKATDPEQRTHDNLRAAGLLN